MLRADTASFKARGAEHVGQSDPARAALDAALICICTTAFLGVKCCKTKEANLPAGLLCNTSLAVPAVLTDLCLLQRLAIAKEFGDKAAERRAYSNLGNAHIFLGRFDISAEYYK